MIFREQWFWWYVLGHFAQWVYGGWLWSGFFLATTRVFPSVGRKLSRARAVASRLKGELQPLYWPAAAVLMIDTMQNPDGKLWAKPLACGLYVWMWYLYKNEGDDNDRWKKRLEKLKEKVTVNAGRLEVTPV